MSRPIRKVNLILLAVVLWQGYLLLSNSQAVRAQTVPFLGRPFYGPAVALSARFDHQYPDYDTLTINNALGQFTRNDGVTKTSCQSVDFCYSGHDGVDFKIAYQPVIAAAAGTIVFAGWANPNHEIDYGLMVKINHGNNHRTLYGHLSMVRYQSGMAVQRWQIGTSGTTGNSTGPHLHFGVQYNQAGTWKIKDPYSWIGVPGQDPWEQQSNVHSEFLWLPEPQRTTNPPPNNGWEIVDNTDGRFNHTCASGQYWVSAAVTTATGGELLYTYTNGQNFNCSANWTYSFPDTGQYEVLVYVPTGTKPWNTTARTHAARYTIHWAGGNTNVVVDQRRVGFFEGTYVGGSQWISLGRYNFNQGSTLYGYVEVTDAAFAEEMVPGTVVPGTYVEPPTEYHTLLVDAVQFIKTH